MKGKTRNTCFRLFILAHLLALSATVALAQKDSITRSYIPEIDGVIRAKFEYNSSTGKNRFEVRNARFMVTGFVTKVFNYKAEIDLSDEGQIKMLDAWVKFIPVKGLSFTLGQQKIPFSTDNLRSPGSLNFSNRSFIAKRICKDLRDIGFMATYQYDGAFPFAVHAAVLNGSGINTAMWTKMHSFATRLELGPWKGGSLTACYFTGKVGGYNADMFNAGFNYRYKNFFFDMEYAQKHTRDTIGNFRSNGAFAYALYEIPLKKGIIRNIVPALRYDFFTGDMEKGIIEPSRITSAVTLGFHKVSWADIRISYEKYLYKTMPDLDDKATIEFIARF
jgi:hypothetical protein